MFSEKELAFLRSQRLLRLATVSPKGQPDADAVGFEFDGAHFYIGGHALPTTRKYKNVANGNTKVSLIIDDLASINPWEPRGIKVHGTAKIVQRAGQFGEGHYLMITPTISWSWGLEGDSFINGKFTPHRITWPVEAL